MKKRPFSMIEILVAMTIIVLLAGLVIGVAAHMKQKARKNQTRAHIAMIEQAMERFFADYSHYPAQASGKLPISYLAGLKDSNGVAYVDFSSTSVEFSNDGTYLLDPFDQAYYFECPGSINTKSFDVWSKGPDTYFADNSGS